MATTRRRPARDILSEVTQLTRCLLDGLDEDTHYRTASIRYDQLNGMIELAQRMDAPEKLIEQLEAHRQQLHEIVMAPLNEP